MIRLAKPDDRDLFKGLWSAYQKDNRSQGWNVLASAKNRELGMRLFFSYTQGLQPGLCLLWEDTGFTMWGEPPGGYLQEIARMPAAMGWGTYVAPESRQLGVGTRLTEEAMPRLRKLGFKSVTTFVRPGGGAAKIVRDLGFSFDEQAVNRSL
jgi:GNAT superfamily N-acetyltransferase